MDRGAPAGMLAWLVVPVATTLIASALSLALQPYTGLILRGPEVIEALPGSPGSRAGIAPGDRLAGPAPAIDALWGPLAGARPHQAIHLQRTRGSRQDMVRIVPAPLPSGERLMMVALLALAAGFVLLGGWVWSERRDRLTLPFHLLCLAFAILLAPHPRLPWTAAVGAHAVLYTLGTLLLPALSIHFFAMFPDPRASGHRLRALVRIGYGLAALLSAAWLLALSLSMTGTAVPATVLDSLQAAAALWFAAGMLVAVAVFGRSYRRADSEDARRRIRVTLIGTALGVGPLAAMIVVRNLFPGVAIPGERLAVLMLLLVPVSFAWAIAVHRIFDFRIALRGAVIASLLVLLGAALYFAGDGLNALRPGRLDYGGVALAAVALAAVSAGPVRPTLRALGSNLLPLRDERPLTEVFAAGLKGRDHSSEILLARACETLMTALRLDRCAALEIVDSGPRLVTATPALPSGARVGHAFAAALPRAGGPLAVDDPGLAPADREALDAAGIQWVLPVGEPPCRHVLLLGRRLAGAWLDRREVDSLIRCAHHLEVALENVVLRSQARSRGALDRELEEAGAIQARLLPRHAPVLPTLDCAAATLSSEVVGGDYYDFVERRDRAFTLVVGDAAGHGVPAALLLAGVQARFRSEATHDQDPGQLLTALNLEMARHDYPEKFVGLLCARVDARRGHVHFANAGLMPPFVRRRDGRWEEVTTGGGLLLGVRRDAQYPESHVELRGGDVIVIYTDGLAEARRGDEMFGPERVGKVLDQHAHRRAHDMVQALIEAVRSFAQGPLDDLTVVVLKQLSDPAPERAEPPGNLPSSAHLEIPIVQGETTDAVSPARAANPRAADH